jgi:hypothetical protein
MEQTNRALAARQALYRAEEYLTQFKSPGRWPWDEYLPPRRAEITDEAREQAKQLFDQAFRAWAEVYKAHAWLRDDDGVAAELDGVIWLYRTRVLKDKQLPDDFPLRDIPRQ